MGQWRNKTVKWVNKAPVSESLGAPKRPNNVASALLNALHLLQNTLIFQHVGAIYRLHTLAWGCFFLEFEWPTHDASCGNKFGVGFY